MNTKLTVDQAFKELHESLRLVPAERKKAEDVHNTITDQLRAAGLIDGAFLQGSFKRRTMLAPLRDVDKVVLLRGEPGEATPGTAVTAANRIADELRRLYPKFDVTVGKHCVNLDFGEHTFAFDIVPAYDLGDDILIVNTEADDWQESNTRTLIRIIKTRNDDCGLDMFVEAVRAGKLFVRENLDGCVPGLHVESFAYTAIVSEMAPDEALQAIFDAGVTGLQSGGSYTDPTGVDRLDTRLDPTDRQAAYDAFLSAAALAKQAVNERQAGNHNAAIAIWYKILGSDFPKPNEREAVSALWEGHGISRVVTPAATVRAAPTRAWRP